MFWIVLFWTLSLGIGVSSDGLSVNTSSRPVVVNVGAIFTFDSTIGRVAKLAIEEAVKDINANSSVLKGSRFNVIFRNSNCSGFLGLVEGTPFLPNLIF